MPYEILIYDIEIRKAIQKKGEPLEPDIEYCGGFRDFASMGIASIAAWDSMANQMWFFMEDNMDTFVDLCQRHDIICGFNNHKFDDVLLETGVVYKVGEKSRDVLRAVWVALGLDPDEFQHGSHTGYGLADLAMENLNEPKIGHGATAPIWYQRGQIGHLASYNIRDVELTRGLINKIIYEGGLLDPKNPGVMIPIDREYFLPKVVNR